MTPKRKKKFNLPTEANQGDEISVTNSLEFNHPFQTEDELAGDSVDEHKKLESANEVIAEKEISQVYNNS